MSTEYDPQAPAFNFKGDREQIEVAPVEVQEEVTLAPSEDSVVEKNRVPYSRFEKVYESAREAREESERYRAEADALRQSQYTQPQEDTPEYWKELFGDTDAAKRAYKAEQQRIIAIEERAETRAIEALEQRQYQQQVKIATNLDTIDNRLDALSDVLGRDLSESEQVAVLDIIDDYTPKDNNGNYAGELLPFDKAWDIYEMKQSQASASTRKSRDNVASISGSKSQGEPQQSERPFNHGAWGSWRSRLNK